MNDPSMSTDVRQARQQRRVGPNAACVMCGITNPEQLRLVRRTLVEQHHVLGKAHDEALMVPLCLNHHAQLTEDQRSRGVRLQNAATFPERLEAMLRGLAAFFERLAERFHNWADQLLAFIQGLDAGWPGWRSMPTAA
jgi:hypothetical protein